jgi:hypothetical protein
VKAGRRLFNQQLAGRLINAAKALATESAPGVWVAIKIQADNFITIDHDFNNSV